MILPSITPKQQQILQYLYTYRFLTRPQLQLFMGHSDKRRIHEWLLDLQKKKYIERNYDTDFIGRTKPASYYLSINGIRWLRTQGNYPESELIKRHRDTIRSASFIEGSQLVAAAALEMEAMEKAQGTERYFWATPSDYHTWDEPFTGLIAVHPSLLFIRYTFAATGRREAPYLLEIVRRTASPLYLRQRLTTYLRYLSDDDWQETFKVCPTVLYVCPDKRSLRAAKRYARRLLQEDVRNVPIRFTTLDTFAAKGIRAPIWEPAKPPVPQGK